MNILSKEAVINAIEGKETPERVPVLLKLWAASGFYKGNDAEKARKSIKDYPDDFTLISVIGSMYTKENTGGALDNSPVLENFEEVDDFIKNKIHRNRKPRFGMELKDRLIPSRRKRYRLLTDWFFLFESFWDIRGMTNALVDFYDYPEETHKLFRAITDYYKNIITEAKKQKDIDGFFISDDLGTQESLFFSLDVFDEFFYPYYKEIVDHCHSLGVHFWLHSCGNITSLIPKLIEIGVDVIHPIQRYAMDEEATFNEYKNKICFWYGLDVQKTIPYGTADDVEKEIKRVYDIFSKADNGRFMFTCGNGLTPDCPIDSFTRLFEISHEYNPYK